jgi:hypothetical protein
MAVSKDRRNDRQSNQLLGALETASRKRIDPHLEPIKLGLGDMVCEAGGLLKHAYFPEGAVLSLLTVLENGSAIETANIGREGAFGLFAAMYSRVSFNRLYCAAGGRHGSLPNRIVAIGIQAQRTRTRSLRQLFGDAAITSSTNGRVQCHAYDGRENVQVASHDARSGRR